MNRLFQWNHRNHLLAYSEVLASTGSQWYLLFSCSIHKRQSFMLQSLCLHRLGSHSSAEQVAIKNKSVNSMRRQFARPQFSDETTDFYPVTWSSCGPDRTLPWFYGRLIVTSVFRFVATFNRYHCLPALISAAPSDPYSLTCDVVIDISGATRALRILRRWIRHFSSLWRHVLSVLLSNA